MNSSRSSQILNWTSDEDAQSVSSYTTAIAEDVAVAKDLAKWVLADRALVALVLENLGVSPSVLTRLARVNKMWYEAAMDVLWRDVPKGGIRPILSALLEYMEINNRPLLFSTPQLGSWTRFEQVIAPRINTLHLDLKTTYVGKGSSSFNRKLLQDVFYAAPACIKVPNLRKLHVTLDLDFLHVDIMSRLSSPAVEHLSLDIYNPLEGNKRPVGLTTDYLIFLGTLFSFIALHMPNLLSLRVFLPSADFLSPAWPQFTGALMRLRRLQTLIMPSFALPRALLYALTDHPSLTKICAYGADRDPIWTDAYTSHAPVLPPLDDGAHDTTLLNLPIAPRTPRIVLATLTHLTLTASLPELTTLLRHSPLLPRLQHFHAIPPRPLTTPHELPVFLSSVAATFPALRTLHLAPLVFNDSSARIQPGTLGPLHALAQLESLVLRSTAPFALDAPALVQLVGCWPRLRTLVLDDEGAPPSGAALLPLGPALETLHTACPRLNTLVLPVHPALGSVPKPSPALKALNLVLAPPFAARPTELAHFLRALGDSCRVRLAARACGEWAQLTEVPGLDDTGAETARRYVRDCVGAWRGLVREEGKSVGSEWVEELGVEMMVVGRRERDAGVVVDSKRTA